MLAGKILPGLNQAICWKPLFFSFYNLGQSAGNLEGLSLLEISRDYTPEYFCCGFILNVPPLCKSVVNRLFKRTKFTLSCFFLCFKIISASGANIILKQKKNKQSTDLLAESKHFNNLPFASYLTGLIEGDGTIVVPKTERSVKGVLNYPA